MALRKHRPTGETPATDKAEITPLMPASRTAVKTRRRPMLILGGALLLLLAGLVAMFIVQQSQTQNQVVQVRADVARGATIQASDLTTTTVGSIAGLSSVPASQLPSLIGEYAQVDLKAGELLPNQAISNTTSPAQGHTIVGLSLAPGRVPTGVIAPGSKLRLVITAPTQGTDDQTGQVYKATMVSSSANTIQGTGTVVNVEVPNADAAELGMMSAANRVVLVKDSDQ